MNFSTYRIDYFADFAEIRETSTESGRVVPIFTHTITPNFCKAIKKPSMFPINLFITAVNLINLKERDW